MAHKMSEVKSKKAKATKATKATKVTIEAEVLKQDVEKPDALNQEALKKDETITKKKTVKTKVDKYNGFKVPDKKIISTKWAIHVYNMIKEAQQELLQREDVRTAYNKLVECLRKYDGFLESYIPTKYQKYNSGIDIMKNGVVIFNYNTFRWISDNDYAPPPRKTLLEKKAEFIIEFKQIYTPLFDLIKRDVINYMELKKHEIDNKYTIERYHYQMEKIERTIKAFESRLAECYKELGKLSEEVIKCKEPPPLTVFE